MSGVVGLAEVVLWVRDMEAALHFYRDMFGLDIISPPELPVKFLRAGEGASGVPEMIVLVPHPDRSVEFASEKPKRVLHHLALRVEASMYEGLRDRFSHAGLEVRSGVHPVLHGVQTFYVDDPDGNEVECISPDPDRK
jgi:catechol 2,3-dioxygenase-like lactoylglutathione lyase family enzyme